MIVTIARRFDDWRLRLLAGQLARPHGWLGSAILPTVLNRLNRRTNALVLQELNAGGGDTVLDVGFGGALLLEDLLRGPAAHVVGVDVSPEMVRRADHRFFSDKRTGRLTVLEGDVEDLPLDACSVTRACSLHCMYFWGDPVRAVAEFMRVLTPGGRLVLALDTPASLRSWPGSRFGFRIYSPEQVVELLTDIGFRHVRFRMDSAGDIFCVTGEKP